MQYIFYPDDYGSAKEAKAARRELAEELRELNHKIRVHTSQRSAYMITVLQRNPMAFLPAD
ncbi:hypothetical protein LCGC14_1854560 [marine sediment metagenome]|uniref:Uncharacterized protein n=1 Tax=marine sediment metagenome TaxID=412755 RepID=A0A0F9G985_9ZZZZ